MRQSFNQTIDLIRSDMQFRCDYEHKTLSLLRILGFLLNPTVFSQALYRFQIFFYTNYAKPIASFIECLNNLFFSVKIDSRTQIGPRFLLLHANYIHIGKNVTIGQNCILAHQNSIGPAFTLDSETSGSDQGPVIGDNVMLGVGSVVYGNIHIGNHTKVAINSAVDSSFPDNAMLVGVPAKNRMLAVSPKSD